MRISKSHCTQYKGNEIDALLSGGKAPAWSLSGHRSLLAADARVSDEDITISIEVVDDGPTGACRRQCGTADRKAATRRGSRADGASPQ
jgi:hypothetical protein